MSRHSFAYCTISICTKLVYRMPKPRSYIMNRTILYVIMWIESYCQRMRIHTCQLRNLGILQFASFLLTTSLIQGIWLLDLLHNVLNTYRKCIPCVGCCHVLNTYWKCIPCVGCCQINFHIHTGNLTATFALKRKHSNACISMKNRPQETPKVPMESSFYFNESYEEMSKKA
jgi:hypothetical protein